MARNGLGPVTAYNPPGEEALRNYNVNRAGQVEVIWQPFYDYLTYVAAGQTQLTFFQRTVGAGGTTLADTNMRAAGQFPRPWEFLVTGIQIILQPTVLPNSTAAAAATLANTNNAHQILNQPAWLELFIGSKAYLQDGPLIKFPQQYRLAGNNAIAATFAAGTFMATDYAVGAGKYYAITPVKIPANQNFNVTLNWPALQAVTANTRIGVILDGFQYRLSQ